MDTATQALAKALVSYYDDPLGYVLFSFPWDKEESIRLVKMPEPWCSLYDSEYGPDGWACEFLTQLGEDIKSKHSGQVPADPIRYTVSSGHGIGKSVMVSWLIKFILDTRPRSMGVVTANTSEQLRTKTWAELSKWHAMSLTSDWFTYTNSRGNMSLYSNMKDADGNSFREKWRCDAQTCREENAEAFQGLHAASATPFYIFDEASGIPESIWIARQGGATDGEPMSFDFGNPTRKSGTFYENCIGRNKHRYNYRRIDSRDVQITNKRLFDEWEHDWGLDSDFFKVRVKGEFPAAGSVQFISSEQVDNAMSRPSVPQEVASQNPLLIGVDVARFGDNKTVIYPRIGDDARTLPYKTFSGLSITQTVEEVVRTLQEYQQLGRQCDGLFIDGGGLGAGVVDMLHDLGYNPIDVNAGRASTSKNFRFHGHELWGRMKDAMPRLVLPEDDDLRTQLTQREYGFTNDGSTIMLESKRDMEKRGVMSPDIADALALTFGPSPFTAVYGQMSHLVTHQTGDYDPFHLENF